MQRRIPPTMRWLKLVFTSLLTLLAALFAFAERPVAANSGGPPASRIGTGFRSHSGLSNVNCTIGGTSATVDFAGAQGDLAGLDQANIQLPRSLAGRNATLDLVFRVDGKTANTVQITVK